MAYYKWSNFELTLNDYKAIVANLLLEEWEDDTHTLEIGTWESIGTPEISKFNCKGPNTSH